MTEEYFNEMKRTKKKVRTVFLSFAMLFILGIGYGIYWAFFDMSRLPTGEFLTEERSPDGAYTVRAFVSHGHATVADSIRGELVIHNQNDKTKTIYWNYREDLATIEWIDNDTVSINNYILDVPHDKYDFRNP
ncbi:hypothetical protein JCM9140_1561 [Halalkalibacter wakoensis JCM 9140]|uniref:DUF5412 domain-containing protein n=1 Tax=Halalkalibacter wakoensis JCM 9140 TaxID=1236970 RepID=W4Q0F5_9BACI|nr:DUF5412 domain-containing protein [Halalkalibacter wakoensis]GAE25561.1 hypothetical protein JCM9140_1561 [Halalkalibacter wakoensis JCM 9140]